MPLTRLETQSTLTRASRPRQGGGALTRLISLAIRPLLALLLAACVPGDAPTPPPSVGSLNVAITGLPASATGSAVITGPGGYSRVLDAAASLSGLAPGVYTLVSSEVVSAGFMYAPSPASQTVTVVAGGAANAAVAYSLASGALQVSVSGLPTGVSGSVLVTGPNGFAQTLSGTTTLLGLTPGTYQVEGRRVQADGFSYAANPPDLVTVNALLTPTEAPVAYAVASGALAVGIQGLPSGASANVVVTGPNGFQTSLAASGTLIDLAPGNYSIAPAGVTFGSDAYAAAAIAVIVSASLTPSAANVNYAVASGRLGIAINGLPGGSTPSIQVSGPNGFMTQLTSATTLTGLAPGTYTITASNVVMPSASYAAAPSSQVVNVPASTSVTPATVTYAIATGSLSVTIVGLPIGMAGAVTVTGPNAYSTTLGTSTTLVNLAPGSYTVSASTVASGPHRYDPVPAGQTVAIVASLASSPTTVTYALASGLLSLTVNGLPGGVQAAITVSGPNGFSQAVTGSTVLTTLTPGAYQIAASAVSSSGSTYGPSPASQTVTVQASTVALNATVTYSLSVGSLAVTISGLPGGVSAAVSITGPGGFATSLGASQTLSGLAPGTYTVNASSVVSGGTAYTPAPTSQTRSVVAGATASATVNYSAVAAGPNLTIDGLYITQAIQSYTGGVPLVAGRGGFLRVFAKASQANALQPAVRVRFYNGAVLLNTITIPAPSASVPTTITEGTLSSSWNTAISGALLQPGISILADVDPTNTIVESSESDNAYPVSGTPAALDVRTVTTLNVRFVPVTQSVNGLTGNVSVGNKDVYTAPMQNMFPLASIDSDVRAGYTTAAPVLLSNDGNGAWIQILSEISALRVADGSSRYYYGVVKTTYGSGVAGVGFIGGRSAIGWDHLPSGAGVMAHELGHNFGRLHAPCGGAGGPDPLYPYPGGVIGVYGYDLSTSALKPPTRPDLMGYCSSEWISDYTYKAVLDWRTSHPFVADGSSGASARPSLLVWGRVENGQLFLEPAYEIVTRPALPASAGSHTIEGFAPGGERLFAYSFEGEPIADAPNAGDRTFAFAIPLDLLRGRSLDRLSLAAGSRRVERRALGAPGTTVLRSPQDAPVAIRVGAGSVRITWREDVARGVLVRDAVTGEILSFGRGGATQVRTTSTDLEVIVSDGVRSERTRLTPR